jgi:hypothetical protein
MTTFENEQGWQLESLNISYQNWGEFKGKHTAKITFQNKNSDAFTFVLSPDETLAYMHLLKDKMVSNAGMLGQRLLQSLQLLPAPVETKGIGEAIPHEPA